MQKILAVVAALILSACSDNEPSVALPASPKSIPAASSALVSASAVSQGQQAESQKQEADEIAKSENLVERDGKKLTLHLQSGRALELVDSEGCEDYESCRSYINRGLIADKQFFWVLVSFYEGGQSLLISRETGEQVDTIRDPHVSPDGKFVISASDAEAYEDSGVFLWEINKGALVSRFYFVPADYQLFSFVRWVAPTKVELKKTASPQKGVCPENTPAEYPVALVQTNGEWKLEASSDQGKCLANQ